MAAAPPARIQMEREAIAAGVEPLPNGIPHVEAAAPHPPPEAPKLDALTEMRNARTLIFEWMMETHRKMTGTQEEKSGSSVILARAFKRLLSYYEKRLEAVVNGKRLRPLPEEFYISDEWILSYWKNAPSEHRNKTHENTKKSKKVERNTLVETAWVAWCYCKAMTQPSEYNPAVAREMDVRECLRWLLLKCKEWTLEKEFDFKEYDKKIKQVISYVVFVHTHGVAAVTHAASEKPVGVLGAGLTAEGGAEEKEGDDDDAKKMMMKKSTFEADTAQNEEIMRIGDNNSITKAYYRLVPTCARVVCGIMHSRQILAWYKVMTVHEAMTTATYREVDARCMTYFNLHINRPLDGNWARLRNELAYKLVAPLGANLAHLRDTADDAEPDYREIFGTTHSNVDKPNRKFEEAMAPTHKAVLLLEEKFFGKDPARYAAMDSLWLVQYHSRFLNCINKSDLLGRYFIGDYDLIFKRELIHNRRRDGCNRDPLVLQIGANYYVHAYTNKRCRGILVKTESMKQAWFVWTHFMDIYSKSMTDNREPIGARWIKMMKSVHAEHVNSTV